LAGHYHKSWQKEYNGINYYILGALTRDGEEGGHALIDLSDYGVRYEFAK
jgi:hypothetical protein